MIHRLSHSRSHIHRLRAGFTLLEMLVTVGIILLLISILTVVVVKAQRTAKNTRTHRDLETIRVALDEYKNIWSMYPVITPLPTGTYNANNVTQNINNIDGVPMVNDNGAHALYTALVLRGQVRLTRTQDTNGAIHVGGTTAYGPLLNVEQMKVSPDGYFNSLNPSYAYTTNNLFLCDSYGNPILYVPASRATVNFIKTASSTPPANNQYVDNHTTDSTVTPLYDFAAVPAKIGNPLTSPSNFITPFHNTNYGSTSGGMNEMRVLMGDINYDGIIDTTASPPEAAVYTGPYLLWSAGPDGVFGMDNTVHTDDVTNFDFPVQFRKP